MNALQAAVMLLSLVGFCFWVWVPLYRWRFNGSPRPFNWRIWLGWSYYIEWLWKVHHPTSRYVGRHRIEGVVRDVGEG